MPTKIRLDYAESFLNSPVTNPHSSANASTPMQFSSRSACHPPRGHYLGDMDFKLRPAFPAKAQRSLTFAVCNSKLPAGNADEICGSDEIGFEMLDACCIFPRSITSLILP